MAAEESLNKSIYKIVLYLIKTIPMVISGIYLLNTTLSYLGIDLAFLSYIVMFLLIGFLYLASYAFRFCSWHRLFIHYILCNLILNTVDYYYGLPFTDEGMFLIYMIITGLSLFVLLYLKLKKPC